MAWPTIDPTSPKGTDKIKFGDDEIRGTKQALIDFATATSNYTPGGSQPALKTATWTTAGRPSGANLVDKVTGYNTDLGFEEYYDLANTRWIPKVGLPSWTVAGRPASPYVGQYGFNTDLWVIERWSGSVWQRISGGMKGDKKDWIGDYSQAEASNPGWKLCNGQTFTHPEGGSITLPDLRDRFMVGAGTSYAVGATGGANTVSLTEAQNGPHAHTLTLYQAAGSSWNANTNPYWGGDDATRPGGTAVTSSSGSGAAHENRPPYYALCFLYKL